MKLLGCHPNLAVAVAGYQVALALSYGTGITHEATSPISGLLLSCVFVMMEIAPMCVGVSRADWIGKPNSAAFVRMVAYIFNDKA